MTPDDIQARLLKVRSDELKQIVREIHAWPPRNISELLTTCQEAQDAIAVETRRLQEDRTAISSR